VRRVIENGSDDLILKRVCFGSWLDDLDGFAKKEKVRKRFMCHGRATIRTLFSWAMREQSFGRNAVVMLG